MSFRLPLRIAIAASIIAGSTMMAQASTITDTFDYTATGAVTASGSFTVTFDPTHGRPNLRRIFFGDYVCPIHH